MVRVMEYDTYSAAWTRSPSRSSRALRSVSKVLELGQELAERVAAGHAATVLAANVLAVRTGGVLAFVSADEIVALVQVKNNPSHAVSLELGRRERI